MKKAIIIMAFVLTALCAVAVTGCAEEENARTGYDITATFDAENMTVTADMDVHYVNTSEAELDSLYFHLYPSAYREDARFAPVSQSDISDAYPHGVDYGGISVSSVTVGGGECEWEIGGEDEDILIIDGLSILPGGETDVSVSFTLDIPETRNRFGYYDGKLNLGNWYPVACVYEDGGWRTDPYSAYGDPFYSDIADYDVSFIVPEGWEVAGTGNVTVSVDGSLATYEFSADGVRDFAICASESYTCTEGTAGDVTVRFYGTAAQTESGLPVACDAVETFSELFGDYPYDTLSVVMTPFIEGGMEYPSLVMISDALGEELTAEAIIHETAHQWWYAAVGSDQINEPWLDEGLAEYSATLFYEQNPDYGVDIDDRIADAMQSYVLFSDVYSDTENIGVMDRALGEYSGPTEYAFHAYVKGELMFDSLRHILGDDAFFEALRSYYSGYSGKTADAACLIAEFEKSSGMGLTGFFDSWLSGAADIN